MFNWLRELRKTEKGKTIFKLSLYLIFFGIVFILVIITGVAKTPYREYDKNTDDSGVEFKSEERMELTYFEKQKKLINGTYNFTYKITGSKNLEYNGTAREDVVEGFKESEEDLIRYIIENGKVYSILLGERSEYHELYEGLNEEIFDTEKLFLKLNGTSSSITKTNDEKKYHYLDLDGYDYIVSTNEECITKIEVRSADLVYELTYKY